MTSGGCASLYKIYGLFLDMENSFMNGVTPNDDGSFSYVNLWYATQFAPFIPYPSRLYSTFVNKTTYPLAGMRFAINDLLDLKGVLTGGGSRAMARLHDAPLNTTDLGAECIGKTKSSMFAIGEWPWNKFDILVCFSTWFLPS